jgi:hypothetical protein
MRKKFNLVVVFFLILGSTAHFSLAADEIISDKMIEKQRSKLADNTKNLGYGPQSPRDLSTLKGTNSRKFNAAPSYIEMNLCNIHLHKNAEHKGGEFNTYAGNGNGKGYGTGYKYDGKLSVEELLPFEKEVGVNEYGHLKPGDTIEVHYVYSTAAVKPGPSLNYCLDENTHNPQLRVEAQVYVLVNDPSALDFAMLTRHEILSGFYQAPNIPKNTGVAVEYSGSTTGPDYNETGSHYQVTWNVRLQVEKVSISSLDTWFNNNIYDEDDAHAVRNLVINPDLLSVIKTLD